MVKAVGFAPPQEGTLTNDAALAMEAAAKENKAAENFISTREWDWRNRDGTEQQFGEGMIFYIFFFFRAEGLKLLSFFLGPVSQERHLTHFQFPKEDIHASPDWG